jgi:hypothetical protein
MLFRGTQLATGPSYNGEPSGLRLVIIKGLVYSNHLEDQKSELWLGMIFSLDLSEEMERFKCN